MESLFRLRDSKHNFHLLAFQFHTLDYSLGMLKNKRNELRKDPILKYKLDNYILMVKLSIRQKNGFGTLPFDINRAIDEYLNSSNNVDLKNYINICNHIVARELDMAELCSKVEFDNHIFKVVGKDLYCVDSNLSTVGSKYNDIEKDFLCSCAKRCNKILKHNSTTSNSSVISLYSGSNENSNLIKAA